MLAAAAEHRDIVRVLGDEAAGGCGVAGFEVPEFLEMVVEPWFNRIIVVYCIMGL